MIRWLWTLLALPILALPAVAQDARPVDVATGDHDGFTRVVLQAPGLTGWRLNRLTDGYAVTLRQPARFDLSDAFRLISRSRLVSLTPTEDQRGLRLEVGCACHAIGFDYRPGVVVIDIRDGPPPEGSSFELAADGQRAEPLEGASTSARPRTRPEAEAWDWARDWRGARTSGEPIAGPPLPPSLQPPQSGLMLREALLADFAAGASRGLIEPVDRPPKAAVPTAEPPTARVGLLGLPGLTGLPGATDPFPLSATGAPCIAADRLDVPTWGDPDLPAVGQMAEVASLLGEFDRPDPVSVATAVKRHLWLGFGAEAAQLAKTFASDSPDAALWQSMGRAVDGIEDPGGAFAGMLDCDGPAALWSAMTESVFVATEVDRPALLSAFSALPPHLRRHLGPPLAERFVAAGDVATAQSLRDAMGRGVPEAGPLVDATLALATQSPDMAEEKARAVISAGGPDMIPALTTLVEARAQTRKPMSFADVTLIEALLAEQPDDPALARAALLSRALAGDFATPFSRLPELPSEQRARVEADLWSLLAEIGPDADLLNEAIRPPDAPHALARPETRDVLADRLTELGFGRAARQWLGQTADAEKLARADLAEGDARSALIRLAGLDGTTAPALRAQALLALGEADAAAQLFSEAAMPKEEQAARLRARDWVYLQGSGPPEWQAAVAALSPTPQRAAPLADGRALVDKSDATRRAVAALLDETAAESR
jgi:hypothetical protein